MPKVLNIINIMSLFNPKKKKKLLCQKFLIYIYIYIYRIWQLAYYEYDTKYKWSKNVKVLNNISCEYI